MTQETLLMQRTSIITVSAIIILTSPLAHADDFLVKDTRDSCGSTGPGSFREGILKANQNPGPDRIVLAGSAAGRIMELCDCLPSVTDGLEIDATRLTRDLVIDSHRLSGCTTFDFAAPGALFGKLVISGGRAPNGAVRVRPNQHVRVSISRVEGTVRPRGPGAIVVEGELLLSRTRVVENEAANGAGVSILGSSGSAIISEASFESNTGVRGGALLIEGGKLHVARSTFTGNAAETGGVLHQEGGTVVMESSTLSGNKAVAGGAILLQSGQLDLFETTIAFNASLKYAAGLMVTDGWVYVRGTLLSNHAGPACTVQGAGKLDGDFNLDHDGTCRFSGRGNIAGRDPGLSPLGSHGGLSATHAIGWKSAAHDTGDPAGCGAYDQRGQARPGGRRCDIGAFELP